MLKLRLFRLWRVKNSAVLFLGQAVERSDIFPGKGLCRGHGRRDAVRRNADHHVRDLLRHVQLVQGHDDRKLLLMRQFLQNGQQFDLALDIQKRGGFVQQKHLRLLTDCPRQ